MSNGEQATVTVDESTGFVEVFAEEFYAEVA